MFYRIFGLIILAGLLAFLSLVGVSVALLAFYRRSGRVAWPRLSAFAAGLVYSPLCTLFRLFGKPTQVLDLFLIDAANAVLAGAFERAGPVRLLVGPQCMRAGGCKARLHPVDGYQCVRCGRCVFADLAEAADECGFRMFIVPGDRFALRLVKKHGADAAIGVACPVELSQAMVLAVKLGLPSRGVPLSRDGCFETDVDVEQVKEAMRRCGKSSTSQD